jgi:uncharacterized integral membrane protein (TIGR00698 family)
MKGIMNSYFSFGIVDGRVEESATERMNIMKCMQGVLLTLALAVAARVLASLPFLSMMGQLVIAILLGMAWRAAFGVQENAGFGISFAAKTLLRAGIILLGMRLHLGDVAAAGGDVLIMDCIVIAVTLTVVYVLSRMWKVDPQIGLLTACGTAICGAAAVGAIGSQVEAKQDQVAVSTAVVAVLGTIFTLGYTLLYPYLGLSEQTYGAFSGATLHEIAHVLAAAAPAGGEAVDLAVVVKLTRVVLLVPVAVLIGWWTTRRQDVELAAGSWRSLPIPWFIFGFLAMSGLHSLDVVSDALEERLVDIAYLLMAMAMAGLGLNVNTGAFRRYGVRAFAAGLAGSVLLSLLGFLLVRLFPIGA